MRGGGSVEEKREGKGGVEEKREGMGGVEEKREGMGGGGGIEEKREGKEGGGIEEKREGRGGGGRKKRTIQTHISAPFTLAPSTHGTGVLYQGCACTGKTGEIAPSKLLERWPHVCRRLEPNIGTCRIITLNSEDI